MVGLAFRRIGFRRNGTEPRRGEGKRGREKAGRGGKGLLFRWIKNPGYGTTYELRLGRDRLVIIMTCVKDVHSDGPTVIAEIILISKRSIHRSHFNSQISCHRSSINLRLKQRTNERVVAVESDDSSNDSNQASTDCDTTQAERQLDLRQ